MHFSTMTTPRACGVKTRKLDAEFVWLREVSGALRTLRGAEQRHAGV